MSDVPNKSCFFLWRLQKLDLEGFPRDDVHAELFLAGTDGDSLKSCL